MSYIRRIDGIWESHNDHQKKKIKRFVSTGGEKMANPHCLEYIKC